MNAAIVEETGQSKQKQVPRKHALDTLNGCLCGEVVNSLKLPSNAIIKCKELGCETASAICQFSFRFSVVWGGFWVSKNLETRNLETLKKSPRKASLR